MLTIKTVTHGPPPKRLAPRGEKLLAEPIVITFIGTYT